MVYVNGVPYGYALPATTIGAPSLTRLAVQTGRMGEGMQAALAKFCVKAVLSIHHALKSAHTKTYAIQSVTIEHSVNASRDMFGKGCHFVGDSLHSCIGCFIFSLCTLTVHTLGKVEKGQFLTE